MITDLLLVIDSKNEFKKIEMFSAECIIDFYSLSKKNTPLEWGLSAIEYPFFLAQQEIEEKIQESFIRGILIDLSIGDKSTLTNTAVDLAIYLRLSMIKLPLFIISETPPIENNQMTIPPLSYEAMKDYGVGNFVTHRQAFDKKMSLDGGYPIYERLNEEFDLSLFLDRYNISQPDNRHQITNEWGAVKLALNAGYTPEEIQYNFPQTLYFKFLIAKFPLHYLNNEERKSLDEVKEQRIPFDKIDLSTLLSKKKILLIDDNAGKGWKNVLQKIFNTAIRTEIGFEGLCKISDYIDYDIVFLDLYLPHPVQKDIIDMEFSIKLLKDLKNTYPQIPIIVFTASNKAWTMDEVFEKGADGMYVKEAPEYAGNQEYSKENFKNFLKTVVGCLIRYETLRPYWEKLEFIEHNFLPEIQDDKNKKLKSRIKERMEMFYGLLKRGAEEKGYNRNRFYFSDYELAFMTLWSVLNEISEAHYSKVHISDKQEYIDKLGNKYFLPPIPGYNWKIKEQSDYLIKHNFDLNYDGKGKLELINSSPKLKSIACESHIALMKEPPYFEIRVDSRDKVTRELFLQIAFLVLKSTHFQNIEVEKRNLILTNLKKLNEVRNKLYLTHGDTVSTGFYGKTEKCKREDGDHRVIPLGDIKSLFELVGFLLTGVEIIIEL